MYYRYLLPSILRLSCIIFFLFLGASSVYARQMQELPDKGVTQYISSKVQTSKAGVITIQLRQDALQDVLQRLRNITGMRFIVDASLFKVPMSGDVKGHDWAVAIKELLRDFEIKIAYREKGQIKAVFVRSLKKQLKTVYANVEKSNKDKSQVLALSAGPPQLQKRLGKARPDAAPPLGIRGGAFPANGPPGLSDMDRLGAPPPMM